MPSTHQPLTILHKNIANIVSFLGVLPICLLFSENGYQYIIPLILFNNMMDDLDGLLAATLNIRSTFGALLDNVCDAVVHVVFLMAIGMHVFEDSAPSYLAYACLLTCLSAAVAMITRVVHRVNPDAISGIGSPTNELMRHLFFIILLARHYNMELAPFLTVAFILNSCSLIAPFKLPYMVRTLAKSAFPIILVNVAMLVAWLYPATTVFIAALFFGSYLLSFATGTYGHLKNKRHESS